MVDARHLMEIFFQRYRFVLHFNEMNFISNENEFCEESDVMAYEYLFSVSLFIFVSKQSMKMLQCLSWKYCVFLGPNIDRHENISIASSRISTSFLRRKKVQSPAKQFKELFSLCSNHFWWNEIVDCEV